MPSDRDIARAQALGRLAGRVQRPVESNPYSRDERVLRARWVLAYVRAGWAARLGRLSRTVRDGLLVPPASD